MMNPDINKSQRHTKIIGNFGENLICNWLSRSGFEVAIVDQTGIDIIAFNQNENKRYGITVKARTRNKGTEQEQITIFKENKGDRKKLQDACKAFHCEPWIAIYVETRDSADVYLTSLSHYDSRYCKKERAAHVWKMRDAGIYKEDREVKHVRFEFHTSNWFKFEL